MRREVAGHKCFKYRNTLFRVVLKFVIIFGYVVLKSNPKRIVKKIFVYFKKPTYRIRNCRCTNIVITYRFIFVCLSLCFFFVVNKTRA